MKMKHEKRSKGLLAAGVIGWLASGGAGVRADLVWDIQQLTFDGGTKASISAHNGSVAWSRFDGVHNEVFLWNGSTISNLSALTGKEGARVSLYNGTVAWVGDDGIYYWDGATATRISTDAGTSNPSLYGGTVAWTRFVSGDTFELRYWNGSTVQTLDTWADPSWASWSCSLYDGKAAYKSGGLGGGVWYWDGAQRIVVDGYGSSPSLYDGKIAYVQSNTYISYWDGADRSEVDSTSRDPSLSNDDIAYSKLVNNSIWQIMFWDGATTDQVTHDDNSVANSIPSLDVSGGGTRIAWLKDIGGLQGDIYYARLVPEPSTAVLVLLGLGGAAQCRRRRQ